MFDKLNEIFSTDFNLDTVFAARQDRGGEVRVKQMDKPRRLSGLFYITDYPATYRFLNETCLEAAPGDVIFLPEGVRYTTEFHVPAGKTSHPILINFRITSAEGEEIRFDCPPIRLLSDNGTLLSKFTAAVQLYKNASPILLKAKVFDLIGSIFPLPEADDLCLNYIREHITEEFYIPALAKKSALSESEYRKRFRKKVGVSPVRYITRLKIEKACEMLLDEDITPDSVSEFLHFGSVPYFYKIFKEQTGLTPNQYRNGDVP
ncbi:MAG: helix-turn-helix transcriptional regulator [Clostridia bacterium]|nr:helix-turn-helix transcriptional regulator [Clostridia bacterium]